MQFASRFQRMVPNTASYTEPIFSFKRQRVPRYLPLDIAIWGTAKYTFFGADPFHQTVDQVPAMGNCHCLYVIDTDTIMQLFLSETVGLFLFILMTSTAGEVCLGPVCEYLFNVSLAETMTTKINGKVFSVGLNGTRLQVIENSLRSATDYPDIFGQTVHPDDVITADGFSRDVIVVNGQFPGPPIEVMEGVQVGYTECR